MRTRIIYGFSLALVTLGAWQRFCPQALAREVMNEAGSLKSRINRRAQSLAAQLKSARAGQGSAPQYSF
ncbi:MAG: hypothetical protein NTW03_03725 [Verrucomicrobia bacterium]|nr:hypothetical protein [Verrucomicrobiota bacterium]